MNPNERKTQYLQEIEKTYEEVHKQFKPIKEQVESMGKKTESELKNKFGKLQERLDELRWQIDNFRKSELPLDKGVEHSFDEAIDEINWRMKEVKAALKGQEIWESGEASKRGKKLFEGSKD
ncbi:hypothetical protein GWO43_00230 [candidate division KSB1 bacterium]|nr:hypothetical protein [candidate division KSB1 bacterium]NIR68496.1 hypothetical protein [candidate division KSB1 bacterium]NIS22510.1 hypothetical protein [candidate division KSB1 bacterium]NIT69354.1 hypothetical protein [candidate division KSB1 bacterium]NIU23015.1 hypothetical protein [candidate division KSB1 bacterium]